MSLEVPRVYKSHCLKCTYRVPTRECSQEDVGRRKHVMLDLFGRIIDQSLTSAPAFGPLRLHSGMSR